MFGQRITPVAPPPAGQASPQPRAPLRTRSGDCAPVWAFVSFIFLFQNPVYIQICHFQTLVRPVYPSACPLCCSRRSNVKLKVLLGGGAYRLARAFALPAKYIRLSPGRGPRQAPGVLALRRLRLSNSACLADFAWRRAALGSPGNMGFTCQHKP